MVALKDSQGNGPKLTPAQGRAARGLLNLTVAEVAAATGLGRNTVTRFEQGMNVHTDTMRAMERFYESEGVVFTGKTGTELPKSEGE